MWAEHWEIPYQVSKAAGGPPEPDPSLHGWGLRPPAPWHLSVVFGLLGPVSFVVSEETLLRHLLFKSALPNTSTTPTPHCPGRHPRVRAPALLLLCHPLVHPAILSGSCDPLSIKVMHKCEHLRQGWIFHFVLFQKSTRTPHALNISTKTNRKQF